MTKARFSISLDEALAELIKEAAAKKGVDVSSYMGQAAVDAMERDARIANIFMEINVENAAVDKAAEELEPWPPPLSDGELSQEEHAAIVDRWATLFGPPKLGTA